MSKAETMEKPESLEHAKAEKKSIEKQRANIHKKPIGNESLDSPRG